METGLIIAGTNTKYDVVAVVGVEVCTFAEMIPSACVAASEISVLANVKLGIVGTGMETPE